MPSPYTYQQQICPSNATYIQAQITQLVFMGQVCLENKNAAMLM